jgi:hypothetical protein
MRIDPVLHVLDRLGARYALIGAHALAARGYPRFTVDVDMLTTAAAILDGSTWAGLEGEGAKIERRRGDIDDPLAGVVHILLADGTDIDLILAKWPWEAAVIERAEVMTIREGLRVPVPQTADLILLKLSAGGILDLRDAAVLLSFDRERLIALVESRLPEVRPDARDAWHQVVTASL